MRVPPFELDHWLHEYEGRAIPFDLSGSTGPVWTIGEILGLGGLSTDAVQDIPAVYSSVLGAESLRSAVAEAWDVGSDQVQVTTGASEALTILTAAHHRPGGNVLVPDPGYPPFAALAKIFGLEVRRYRLRRDHDFRLDPEEAAAQIDANTSMVIVNSPHNPTGACVTRDQLQSLQNSTARHGATLVVDQVFHPLSHGAEPLSGLASEGMVVVGDTAKALSLAGPRIGWIIDSDPERRKAYFDLRAYFTLSSVPLAERLTTIALQNRDQIWSRAQAVASQNLEQLNALIDRHPDRLGWVRPSGGTTAFPWLKGGEDARPVCRQLADAGILVAPGDCFGHLAHFRLGFGATEPQPFAQAMQLFARFLA